MDEFLQPGKLLPPPPMRGDWAELAIQIGFKTQGGDLKDAAKIL